MPSAAARPSIVSHLGAVRLQREHGAGLHRHAVDMHDAGAALAGVAADMGAGEPELLAQQLDQQRAALDLDRVLLAVHRQGHLRHCAIPPWSSRGRSVVTAPRDGQAGATYAGTISVLAKSAAFEQQGNRVFLGKRVRGAVTEVQLRRVATLPEAEKGLAGKTGKLVVNDSHLKPHSEEQPIERHRIARITSTAKHNCQCLLQAHGGQTGGRRLLDATPEELRPPVRVAQTATTADVSTAITPEGHAHRRDHLR